MAMNIVHAKGKLFKILSSKTYHFSLVTEKRQFFVLLVAEDGCKFTREPFLYCLTAVESFLIVNLISRKYVIFYTSFDKALFLLSLTSYKY